MTGTFAAAAVAAARLAAVLGWTPNVFWAATPADLRHALGVDLPEAAPAGRDVLESMMERHPDG